MNINLLNEIDVNTLRNAIESADNIVITCHKSPDGDALGSSLAWYDFLTTCLKKNVSVVVPDAFPDFLRWLPHVEKVVRYDKHPEKVNELFDSANLVFCLDYNTASRVEEMKDALEACKAPKIMIDHHLNPSMETLLCISNPAISSTSEIVFRLIWQMNYFDAIEKHCAVAIYCGMMTDTGGFTYNSSYPEIFFIISQLLTKGFDKDKIYRNVYNNYSAWAIRFRGYMMCQKLNVLEDFHASYFAITREDMDNFHFTKGDAEGLVNEPLKIKGMKLSIALREDSLKENTILVSLRSVDNFPCNEMAAQFYNGGGHLNASGGRLNCTIEEAVNITRRAIEHYAHLLK